MDRRTFTKMLAGLLTATALPTHLQAKSPLGNQASFLKALEQKPWLLGYLGTREIELRADVRIVSGRVPKDLKGDFFRNGPAHHNIGSDRFSHWFDAPGMVQKFNFAGDRISHHGRLINTARNLAENKAQNILFNGFGTYGDDVTTGGSADAQNVGNISLVKHAGELLALWEGGSAHVIDPKTLEVEERKVWSSSTDGTPFGAHPRIDRDGSMWNIGYSVDPAALIIYHISAGGQMLQTHVVPQAAAPMVHDFLITETKIIIVAPPYTSTGTRDKSFLDIFEWRESDATQVLVIDKSDLTNITRVEMDAFWVYHFGNAYDISPTEIGFDFAHHDSPDFMTKDAFAVMDGSWDGTTTPASRYVKARIDLNAKRAKLERLPEFGQVEFIETDERQNLSAHRYALMLSQPKGPAAFGFNRLVLVDRETGNASHFDLGETELLEEHLIVPKGPNDTAFWIVGTSLDWKKGITNLSVYDGSNLADGPVMRAELDLALPLGLHGTFVASA